MGNWVSKYCYDMKGFNPFALTSFFNACVLILTNFAQDNAKKRKKDGFGVDLI